MRRTARSLVVVIAVAVAVSACGAPRATFGARDDAAVRAVLLAQRDAWNRGDLAGYMAGYEHSPDLVFTAAGQIRHGWDETFAKYRAKYTDAATMGHLDFELLSVQPLGSDGAIVLGRWRLTGTPVAAGGVFSVALVRGPAGWHVVHDHTSVDPPEDLVEPSHADGGAEAMPADVQALADRWEACQHWADEEPYDQARRDQIAAGAAASCPGNDETRERLKKKYAGRPDVIAKLGSLM